MNAAFIYNKTKDFENCLNRLETIINFNPAQMANVKPEALAYEIDAVNALIKNARLMKANILTNELQNYELALNEYNTVLSTDQLNGEALLGKAGSLINSGNNSQASAVLQEVINNNLPEKEMAEIMLSKIQ